jgi:hypothetical protein
VQSPGPVKRRFSGLGGRLRHRVPAVRVEAVKDSRAITISCGQTNETVATKFANERRSCNRPYTLACDRRLVEFRKLLQLSNLPVIGPQNGQVAERHSSRIA